MGANAQTSVPAFTTGQVLTAQQQTEINTGVPVFATTTTRDAAFGGTGEKVLAQGQLCYLESTNVVQYYNGTSWATLAPTTSAVVQVKSTSKTDVFTSTSSTFTDVTGLSVSITPTSASNNVLVIASVTYAGLTSTTQAAIRLMRGSTAIAIGDAASTRTRASSTFFASHGTDQQSGSTIILDSPATTSATTYKVQIASLNTGNTSRVNGTADDSDDPTRARTFSSITVMEVTP